jgi:hypothetical protein
MRSHPWLIIRDSVSVMPILFCSFKAKVMRFFTSPRKIFCTSTQCIWVHLNWYKRVILYSCIRNLKCIWKWSFRVKNFTFNVLDFRKKTFGKSVLFTLFFLSPQQLHWCIKNSTVMHSYVMQTFISFQF